MSNMKPETRDAIKTALRHPVQWWRGTDLPEENIRPWEGGIQFFAEALKGFMGGFTGLKNRLYEGQGKGKIPPLWIGGSNVIGITWDALNDPLIGSFMDRRNYGMQILRAIMRINATLSPLLILFQCFDLGLSPLQRIIQWTILSMFGDLMSTANAVGEAKIWAGITPHLHQRSIVQVCKTLGTQMAAALSAAPLMLMSLKDVFGITDYQIMIWGAIIFAPLTIFCRWLPSFAKQRVDFTKKVRGEDELEQLAEDGQPVNAAKPADEKPPTLRESFAVVKHNKWFIMCAVVKLITVFAPGTDQMFLYRFLLPKIKLGKNEIGGEMIFSIKNIVVGLPGTFLQPFAMKFAKLLGGDLNMVRAKNIIWAVTSLLKYVVGYKTFPRLIFMFVMEMIHDIFNKWEPISNDNMRYQMLDYVEWKTGQRSEGMTMAVNGFLDKLIRNNVSNVVSNGIKQWTGYQGWDIPKEQQPPRFLNTIWPLMNLSGLFSGLAWVVGLLWFKPPVDPKVVEEELIERRKQAEELEADAYEEK